jgi:nucleotide-binding universal stress UspA family protein
MTGRPLLVATDFSETAEAAADWAVEIAAARGHRIHLMHVLTLPPPRPHYAPAPPDLQNALRDAATQQLAAEEKRLAGRGVEVETILEIGVPSQTLVRTARELDAALLVIGTRGLTGLTHLLLGSTAERVVQHAECPVLTVHPEDAGEHRDLTTVLVPTDFSSDAQKAIHTAHRLLEDLDEARLILLHAFNLPVEYTAYGPIPTSVNYLEDAGIEAEQQLNRIASELEKREGLKVETLAREGYPPEVICAEAEKAEADLIVMGTHGRSGLAHLLLGSTAERVVQKAPCPVMTVRCGEEDEED